MLLAVIATAAAGPMRLLRSVGERGSAFGQFEGPRHAAALATGGCCIVDGQNERIQVFSADGECVRVIEGMVVPTGVAIGGNDGTSPSFSLSCKTPQTNNAVADPTHPEV